MWRGKEEAGLECSLVGECLACASSGLSLQHGRKGMGGGREGEVGVGTEGQGLGRNQTMKTMKTVFFFSSLKLALNV